jgi:hypothetical protein
MNLHDLHDFQERMFHLYVRNVMFFASFPYYVAAEMRLNHK